jgi:hypothetical protein
MPIIKPAQRKKHKYKNGTNTQTNTKQTNKQTKEYNIILQEKIYKSTGAKPLYSEETQVCLFKNVRVQRKICFKEVTGFLKISVSLRTRLAAVTHRAVGEFLQVAVNREGFLTLREGGTRMPVVSKRDRQHFRPE